MRPGEAAGLIIIAIGIAVAIGLVALAFLVLSVAKVAS